MAKKPVLGKPISKSVKEQATPQPQRPRRSPFLPASDLTERQKRFLKVAYGFISSFARAVKDEAWNDAVFDISDIARIGNFAPSDAADIARILDRDFGLIELTLAFSSTSVQEPYRAILTDRGRECARQLHDDKRAGRRAAVWKVVARVWAVLLTIAVPLSVTWLNRKIERLERQATPISTQPTSNP